jgi:O-antigen ligase
LNLRIEQTNWTLVVTVIGACLVAILLGIVIGTHDYFILTTDLHDYWTLIAILLVVAIIMYVASLQHFTWQMALLICYLGILVRPIGFDMGPIEFTCGLGGLLAIMTFWRHLPQQSAGILKDRRFKLITTLLFLWILYATTHMVYNIYHPFRPAEFALKNALKSYVATLGPPVLLWYFAVHPGSLRIKGNVMRTLSYLLLAGLIFNLLVTSYGIATHHNLADPDAIDYMPSFWISGINARENPYMLRTLGPASILLGAMTLALGRAATGISKKLSFILLFAGSIGCLLSGGRAAVTVSIALVLATLLLRRRVKAFMAILGLAGLTLVFVNVFSGSINRNTPVPLLRPLQWIMLEKNEAASNSIDSSTRWREELFQMAIDEWKSDPRIFWFGRATYGFGAGDVFAYKIKGHYVAALESSLRRGATHNLVTDLLVTYGLIGCILYYCIMFAIIRFLWFVYRSDRAGPNVLPLAFFCLIIFASYILIATVQAGTFLPDTIWLFIVLIATLNHFGSTQLSNPAEAVPARAHSP